MATTGRPGRPSEVLTRNSGPDGTPGHIALREDTVAQRPAEALPGDDEVPEPPSRRVPLRVLRRGVDADSGPAARQSSVPLPKSVAEAVVALAHTTGKDRRITATRAAAGRTWYLSRGTGAERIAWGPRDRGNQTTRQAKEPEDQRDHDKEGRGIDARDAITPLLDPEAHQLDGDDRL